MTLTEQTALYELMKKEHAGFFILIPSDGELCVSDKGKLDEFPEVVILAGGCAECLAHTLACHAFAKPEFASVLKVALMLLPTITEEDIDKPYTQNT